MDAVQGAVLRVLREAALLNCLSATKDRPVVAAKPVACCSDGD